MRHYPPCSLLSIPLSSLSISLRHLLRFVSEPYPTSSLSSFLSPVSVRVSRLFILFESLVFLPPPPLFLPLSPKMRYHPFPGLSFLPIFAPPSFLWISTTIPRPRPEKTRGKTRFPPNGTRGSGYFKQLLSALPATTKTRLHGPVSPPMIHRRFTRPVRAADLLTPSLARSYC